MGKPYKVIWRNEKYGIVASSLQELIDISKKKFKINSEVRITLEDYTKVEDEEFFRMLNELTCFVIVDAELDQYLIENVKGVVVDAQSSSTETNEINGLVETFRSFDIKEMNKLFENLKSINLKKTVRQLECLKLLKHEFDIMNIEKGYTYIGEAAAGIRDTYSGKRKIQAAENKKPLKKKKELTQLLDQPKISDFISSSDLVNSVRPNQGQANDFVDNMVDIRNGLDHDAKNNNVLVLKNIYDRMLKSMECLEEEEQTSICSEYEKKAKKRAPLAKCPDYQTLKNMKSYF